MGIWKWIKRLFGAKDPVQTIPVIKPDPVVTVVPVTAAPAPVTQPAAPVVVPQPVKAEPVTVPKEPELKVEAIAPAPVAPEPVAPPPDEITQADREASKAAYAAAHPISDEKNYARPVIGVTRLASGAVFMGQGRYGLSASSQKRVYDEAMSLWKSRADPAKLMLIISRLVEPYMFDATVYPDLHALVMYYLTNHSIPPYRAK